MSVYGGPDKAVRLTHLPTRIDAVATGSMRDSMVSLKEKALRLLRAKLFDFYAPKQERRVFCYTGEEILPHLDGVDIYPREIRGGTGERYIKSSASGRYKTEMTATPRPDVTPPPTRWWEKVEV